MRLECRECNVICERVVYPWHCLKSNCENVYAYEDGETMYFGCLWKVFAAEFDMAVFCQVPGCEASSSESNPGAAANKGRLARRGGRRRRVRAADPYGAVRMIRPPRPQCHVRIEHGYDASTVGSGCCNPTFFHDELGGGDAMRLIATSPAEADDPQA